VKECTVLCKEGGAGGDWIYTTWVMCATCTGFHQVQHNAALFLQRCRGNFCSSCI